jgi:hypothetical protein
MKVSSTSIYPDGKTFSVTLHSKAIAPFVLLNMKDNGIMGWFSDNGFIMVTSTKTLTFKSRHKLSLSTFEKNLEVASLHDAC